MKKVLIILLLVLSCKQIKEETKVKEGVTEMQVDSLLIYNEVLNELVNNHLYNEYLGDEAMFLFIDFFNKKIDSTAYLEKLHTLKNITIKNDSLKGTLYLNDYFDGYQRDIKFLKFPKEFGADEVSLQISKRNHLQIDSLKSKLVILKKLSDKKIDNLKTFEVGELSLSKFLLNKDSTRGMLYFSFVCGEKCGQGSMALIKKESGKWKVVETYNLWEI